MANGLNMRLFFEQLFANRIGGFFGMDVLVSAVALLVFARSERSRLGPVARWLPLIAVLTVGVSLGLPLLLICARGMLTPHNENENDRAIIGSQQASREYSSI